MRQKILSALSILLMISLIFVMSGCSIVSEQIHARGLLKDVKKYLEEDDAEALYDLFSEDQQDNRHLLSRLEVLCHYWNEFEPTIERTNFTNGGGAYEHGKYSYYEIRYNISAVTEDGLNIEIQFNEDYINKNDEDLVGINYLGIFVEDNESYSTYGDDIKIKDSSSREKSKSKLIDEIVDLCDDDFLDADEDERYELAEEIVREYAQGSDPIVDPTSITKHEYGGSLQFDFYDKSTFVVPYKD